MNNLVLRLNNFINSLTAGKVAVLFIIIGLSIYANALTNGFVKDDFGLVSQNPTITKITNIGKFFSTGIFNETISSVNYYRPVPPTAHSIVYLFSNGRDCI